MRSPRVLRVYHAGRDPAHRLRDRALVAAGVDLTLVVPKFWPEGGSEEELTPETFPLRELNVDRPGDVNRHRYAREDELKALVAEVDPDVVDIHEEPFSVAARQWLRAVGDRPVAMYTAQNVDKRLPPPFAQWERAAYRRIQALYPCSRQAASVARGKGFAGAIEVLPLGYDPLTFHAGEQGLPAADVVLGLVGRLVPEKGVTDAIHVLARVRRDIPARLQIIGRGPAEAAARALAARLDVAEAVSFQPWLTLDGVAEAYRSMHVVLLPSKATETWVEQFGRVIVEAQASGAVVAGYASGSIPEVGRDTALLVPEADVDALAAAVANLVTDPDGWSATRARAIEATRDVTWEQVAQRQAELYRRIADGHVANRVLPRKARARRAAARAEFGPTATLAGGVSRPFALPILRRDSVVSRSLAALLDAAQR